MLGDRRKVNRLLKLDRRRSVDHRVANMYTGVSRFRQGDFTSQDQAERRQEERRFSDRTKSSG